MFDILLYKVKSTDFYFQKICLHLLKKATGASKHNKNVLTAPWFQINFLQLPNFVFQFNFLGIENLNFSI